MILAIGVISFVICAIGGIIIFVTAAALVRQWKIAKRNALALKMGAPRVMIDPQHYQPLEVEAASLPPLPFYPETVCPHDGFYDSHVMSRPRPEVDHPDAITVRRCKNCGHIWSEK